ncbi:motile sperm domain-containing protein 2-like, partial [Rhinoraja longicauda]
KMVIYEMPWIMNAAWKIVKTWLGPDALNLLKFANKTDVQEYINVEYLPAHMGGIDPFKYSYPPLPDDDFQTPLCENGPILGEDELDDKEKGNGNCKETVDANHSEESLQKPKKVSVDSDWPDLKIKSLKKPQTVFRGSLLHISPAEEIHFGSKESGETKCLIVLTNVTKSSVAFKVRTTAPDKYRVKPSNGSFEPGASMDILVSLHGGVEASPQDRFLVMAAEVNQAAGAAAPPDLTQFWKEVVRDQVMEHRVRKRQEWTLDCWKLGNWVEVSGMTIIKEKVLGKLKGLKVDNSTGSDGLHPRALKEEALEIVEALVVIVQGSLETGCSR